MFFKIAVLKNFSLSRKQLLESPFNKVAGLTVCIFIKKKTPTQLFSCEYCEILKSTFSYRAPVDFGYKIDIFRILCVIAFFSLCNSIRISISWLFHICFKIVTLVKSNFRTHYNVGSSTILIEWLMFRNNQELR